MTPRTLARRIDRVEEAIKAYSKFGSGCICFPGPAPPFFMYSVLQEIAFKVKCPMHGNRFQLFPHLFVADRFRELEIMRGWPQRSEQYRKAWNASFPHELWTVHEVLAAGRSWLVPK